MRRRKPRTGCSRQPLFEVLEPRELLASWGWGSVTGVVWNDANANGAREATEQRLAGWLVFADVNSNGQFDRSEPMAISGFDGSYRLWATSGTYTILESAVTGWQTTTPASGSYSVTVEAWKTATGRDFGNRQAVATVAGTVWNDQNGNRSRDTGESAQAGWLVYADANDNGQLDRGETSTLSGRDGAYRLTLTPGAYTIRETATTGWQVTTPDGGSYAVTVAIGDALTGKDFGNQRAVGTVSGTVWNDTNGNGTADTGEALLFGWQVYVDANNNGKYDQGEVATWSGFGGRYQLTLPAGTYTIRESVPSSWQATTPIGGSYSVTVAVGDALTGKDFGNVWAVSTLAGTVWNDTNGNGTRDTAEVALLGWQVYADTNNNGKYDFGEATAISGRDGTYRLALAAGTYTIRETVPSGWRVTAPSAGSYSVTVAVGNALTGKDFGNQRTTGTILGTIWNDTNGNGTYDTGEAAMSGWQVYADANNNVKYDIGEAAAISGRDGTYQLTLVAGTYTIRETVSSGWQVTAPSGGSYSLTVAIGDALTGKDFGNRRATGTVSGTVWNDTNGNGAYDTGDAALFGWQVYADANNDGKYDFGEVTAITGRDGTYQLAVAAGTYTIRETVPTGWKVTAPSGGTYAVTVAAGGALTGKDFWNQVVTQPPPSGAFDIDLSLSGLTTSEQTIAQQAVARWEAVIVGDLPDVRAGGRTIDDIAITISVQPIDGSGKVVGRGGPDAFRFGSNLPYMGSIIIDQADVAQMERDGELLDVLTHEIGHVLGLGTIWDTKGLLVGAGTSNPLFTGPQATAAYNAIFGTAARGVPVEASGGPGTALAHWRESVFRNELLVGTIHSGGMPLSTVTVASMADLGYQVNMAAAEAYKPSGTTSSLVLPTGSTGGGTGSLLSSSATSAAGTTSGATGGVVSDGGRDWSLTGTVASTAVANRSLTPRHETLVAVDHAFKTVDWWLDSL